MTLEELKKLFENRTITDITLISYYTNHEDELTELSGEDLVSRGYITDISLANELIKESPDQVTFEINVLPADATVTINGESQTKVTVEYGTEVTWSVTKDNYTEQSGTEKVTSNIVKDITLAAVSGVTGPDGVRYESAQEAINAGVSEITLYSDVDSLTVTAGSDLTIHGNEKNFSGMLRLSVNNINEKPDYNVNIDNLTFKGTGAEEGALMSQDQKSLKPAGMILNLKGCTFENYTQKKCLYFTNAKDVTIDGCTFKNCKAADYIIDFNQCATKDARIVITNCIFETDESNKPAQSFINVKQRGGEDDLAKDVSNGLKIWDTESSEFVENPEGVASTIAHLEISGCTYPDVTVDADIILGDNNNEDGSIRKYSGNFRTAISGDGATVYQKWLGEKGTYTHTITGEEIFTNEENVIEPITIQSEPVKKSRSKK